MKISRLDFLKINFRIIIYLYFLSMMFGLNVVDIQSLELDL